MLSVDPFVIVAVNSSVPAVAGVNLPVSRFAVVTPVVPASLTLHTIVWFIASDGLTVAVVKLTSVPFTPVLGTFVIFVTALYGFGNIIPAYLLGL